MKFARGQITTLIENRFDNALHPEILNLTYDPENIEYTEIQPNDGENIVEFTKRQYHESDAYWILMVLNDILSPFEALTKKVKTPAASYLQTIFMDLQGKR